MDPCITHAPELIVNYAKQSQPNYPTENEIKIVEHREKVLDASYKHPIIPGYDGLVPKIQNHFGKRYMAAATGAVAEFEQIMELNRCEKRNLKHRDILQSGYGNFEPKLGERLVSYKIKNDLI